MKPAFNLFILEDDLSERQLLSMLIEKNFPEWNTRLVACKEQLVQLLLDSAHTPQHPSLLLLDMVLVGSDGTTVLQKVHGMDGYDLLPVVGFSNYSSHVDVTSFMNAGATAYFAKPAGIDQMIAWLGGLPSLFLGDSASNDKESI